MKRLIAMFLCLGITAGLVLEFLVLPSSDFYTLRGWVAKQLNQRRIADQDAYNNGFQEGRKCARFPGRVRKDLATYERNRFYRQGWDDGFRSELAIVQRDAIRDAVYDITRDISQDIEKAKRETSWEIEQAKRESDRWIHE